MIPERVGPEVHHPLLPLVAVSLKAVAVTQLLPLRLEQAALARLVPEGDLLELMELAPEVLGERAATSRSPLGGSGRAVDAAIFGHSS